MNILDVAENSVRAGASLIQITVCIRTEEDFLRVTIEDDGCGMDKEQTEKVQDPFFTTRKTRRVGLGIPFFKQAAECTGGSFSICSEKGKGTKTEALFVLSNIDRMPLGDISGIIHTLLLFNETIDFLYCYQFNEKEFTLDTREIREILGDVSFQEPQVSSFLMDYLKENKSAVDGGVEV